MVSINASEIVSFHINAEDELLIAVKNEAGERVESNLGPATVKLIGNMIYCLERLSIHAVDA